MRLLILAVLMGCITTEAAATQVNASAQTGRIEERSYNLTKRTIWNLASEWAMRNGFSSSESDYEGGSIQFVQNLGTPECDRVAAFLCRPSESIRDWATCPISPWSVPRNGMAKVIMLLTEEDAGSTRVLIETRFVRLHGTSWARCESTGIIEREFFGAIDATIQ